MMAVESSYDANLAQPNQSTARNETKGWFNQNNQAMPI